MGKIEIERAEIMKAVNLNPVLEDYFNEQTGKQMTLDEYLKDEAGALAHEFINKNGVKPPKALITSWMKRLKQAYHKGLVTKIL